MPEIVYPQEEGEPIVVDLRDPYWAAFLAWLWPGAGHFYQRRFAKGFLFMICILSTYFFGLGLGRGRVVYASFKKGDMRWQYICQLGVGIPAFPAIIQSMKTKNGGDPFFVLCERYPADYGEGPPKDPTKIGLRFSRIPTDVTADDRPQHPLKDGFMAPPAGPIIQNYRDTLGSWHFDYKHFFEIGTLFTVVAGMLNLLAVYDAFCGPAILTPTQRERLESKKKRKK